MRLEAISSGADSDAGRARGDFRWEQWGRRGLAALVLSGLLVRITVRDRWTAPAVLFYATPLPLLTAGAAVLALWTWMRPKPLSRIPASLWGAAALFLAGWTHSACWISNPVVAAPAHGIRVLYWNVGRGKFGEAAAFDSIRLLDPDLAILGEVFHLGEPAAMRTRLSHEFRDHNVSLLGGGLVALVKGDSGVSLVLEGGSESVFRQIELTHAGQAITCLAVDLESSPVADRRGPLLRLAELAEAAANRPLLVLGDLNTPTDSVWLQPLRARHRHAFETAGQGWLPTWPHLAPVLSLDQIWINGQVTLHTCTHHRLPGSDHAAILAVITRNDRATSTGE